MSSNSEKVFQPEIESIREFLERFKVQNADALHKARNHDRTQVMLITHAGSSSVSSY